MRLINVKTYALENFYAPRVPKYAILSHRWGSEAEEPTFKDWCKGRKHESPGYRKILEFCSLCEDQGFEYGWSDTVCIDKSSSAELSEAINSMFSWYQTADLCHAYLHDVESVDDLATSAWFTRGWTLQELVAPFKVSFYDKTWRFIGSKVSLKDELASITNIPALILEDPTRLHRASIAQRMSFAATRVCTRAEDEAYCLLGIFNVQMPLLYGEGTRAFTRLQQCLLEQSDDETIFAWTADTAEERAPFSIIARTAYSFRGGGRIVRAASLQQGYDRPPWRMTNKGLEFWALAESWSSVGRSHSSSSTAVSSKRRKVDKVVHIIPLACAEADVATVDNILRSSRVDKAGTIAPCAIALTKSQDGNVYERVDADTFGAALDIRYPKFQRQKAVEKRFFVRRLEYAPTYVNVNSESDFFSRSRSDTRNLMTSRTTTEASDSAYGSAPSRSFNRTETAGSTQTTTDQLDESGIRPK